MVDVDHMSETEQDALVDQLHKNGIKAVRAGISPPFTHFIVRAYSAGIGVVAIVYPTLGSTDTDKRPAAPSVGLTYAQLGVTQADPSAFATSLRAQIAPLEAAGVRLTAFELGNEINGPYFNGDFLPAQASGRLLGLSDLNNPNDPEGRAIAASYRAYVKVAAALKAVRDHTKWNAIPRSSPVGSSALGCPASAQARSWIVWR